ncbi:Fic family protein [Nonomuraea sp. RK-328]|nr:Fic family protein [Nonomuraea sp. RK-328]
MRPCPGDHGDLVTREAHQGVEFPVVEERAVSGGIQALLDDLQIPRLRPQTTVFGDDAYPDLWEKAAALMQSILVGHPLVDGNKRLAWTAAVAFLEDNGEILEYREVDEAESLVIAVTTGQLEDIPELAGRLRDLRG